MSMCKISCKVMDFHLISRTFLRLIKIISYTCNCRWMCLFHNSPFQLMYFTLQNNSNDAKSRYKSINSIATGMDNVRYVLVKYGKCSIRTDEKCMVRTDEVNLPQSDLHEITYIMCILCYENIFVFVKFLISNINTKNSIDFPPSSIL